MKNYLGIILIFLCTAIIFTAGCTSQRETTPPSLIPTASLPIPAASLPPGDVPTVSATPLISLTPTVTTSRAATPTHLADPANVSQMKFLRYSNSDFNVDYPSTWTITTSTYTPYYCRNEVDTERGYYKVCYENEMKSIGPFSFYRDDNLFKSPSRIVIFRSADGTLTFVAFTQDFLDQLNGNVIVVPSFAWVKDEFQKTYPDLFAINYIGNYQEFSTGNAKASSYDVTLPAGHYPPAYTEEIVITVHHLNRFAFITDNENFTQYQNLKQRMLSSIIINDVA
jgi:hypothetical protein